MKRFGTLKRLISDITQKMLTHQLKELEVDALIERKVLAEVPKRSLVDWIKGAVTHREGGTSKRLTNHQQP